MLIKKLKFDTLFNNEGRYLKRITSAIILFSLIIVILVSGVLFVGTNDIVRQEIFSANIGILQQLEMYVDMYVADGIYTTINKNFIQISDDKDMTEFFSSDRCSMGAYYRLTGFVSDLEDSNSFIDSIYIYSTKNNSVVSSDVGLVTDVLFRNFENIHIVKDMMASLPERQFWISPSRNGNGTITFVHLLPTINYEKCDGFVAINVDAETVVKTISQKIGKSGEIAVISPDGSLLAHSDRTKLESGSLGLEEEIGILSASSGSASGKIDNEKYDVVWLESVQSRLKYALLFPEQAYNSRVRILQLYSILVIIGMLFITFIGSKYLSVWVTNPIRKNTSFLEEKLVYDIINGNVTEGGVNSRIEVLNTQFNYPKFFLLMFEASNLAFCDLDLQSRKDVSDKFTKIIKAELAGYGTMVCAKESPAKLDAVLNTESDKTDIVEICSLILKKLKKECDMCFNASVSDAVNKVNFISSMNDDVSKMLEYGYIFGYDNVFCLKDFKEWESNFVSLSASELKNMEGNLRTGEFEEFGLTVEGILDIVKSGKCSIVSARGMLLQVVAVIQRIGAERNIFGEEAQTAAVFSYMDKIKSIDEFAIWISIILEHFKEAAGQKSTKGQREFIARVEKYIVENISSEISLNSVAEAMNISSNYLSRIFKEENGTSFSAFVSEKKLERASELLTTTKIPVSEITKLVGYSNEAYFSKLFKGKYGTTPGQFRKLNK